MIGLQTSAEGALASDLSTAPRPIPYWFGQREVNCSPLLELWRPRNKGVVHHPIFVPKSGLGYVAPNN